MNPVEGPLPADEQEVDALLSDFFRREAPAALPPAVPATEFFRPVAPLAPEKPWYLTATAQLSLAAAALIAVGAYLLSLPHGANLAQPGPIGPIAPAGNIVPVAWTPDPYASAAADSVDLRARWSPRETPGFDVEVTDGRKLIDRKTYRTSLGEVEQRTTLVWTTVSFVEPATGERLESTVPELVVEVGPALVGQ